MTADELQRIAMRLSNSGWCRYFLHWSYPAQDPWLMAVQVRDADGRPVEVKELTDAYGFWPAPDRPGEYVYTIRRTNDDGTPFRSNP